ncbi:MAG: tRNA (N(6)-L-threonylcarbamoyladenosine(37)-C(2))-methylthiotransferase MtaB [Bacteroidales bacterium]|jgi:threonylcarbamoyladenosine tRNA methylthiotransferase MtaB|nr:tRNA (N(6)-L-threonylcarbamoyladenosine(37)-C(2))-methylthiotransferase MtaB [Bacteroidales bacterium]
MNKNKRKVAFYTLGCKLNFAETSTISRSFPEESFEKVSPDSGADIYVINTCTVTDTADRKCRQAIKKFRNLSPGAIIAVTGCYAQLRPEEISSIPGVDLVLGMNEKYDVASFIDRTVRRGKAEIYGCGTEADDSFFNSWSVDDRTRSFLKVQDGCDYRCSYCTIPLARGGSRNPPISTIIREAQDIVGHGVKEIVLTGVNTGDFGKSTGETFAGLLRELVQVPGIERLRISSIEPNLLTDEIIDMAASENSIMPHFHIPLQSGSDRILGLMKRRYRREVFADRLRAIIEKIPLAGIGADVITGFPGETDSDFDDTYNFLKSLPVSYLHAFSFSARPDTPAEKMHGRISPAITAERSRLLKNLSDEKHLEFCTINKGQTASVLFEQTRSGGMITGLTGNYLRVEYPWKKELVNTIREVRIGDPAPSGRLNIELTD